MKEFILLILLLFFKVSLLQAQDHYFRFVAEDKGELEHITRLVSIDKVLGDTVYAYASKQELKNFQSQTDYLPELLSMPRAEAKALTMAQTVSEMSEWNRYPTYQVYMDMMEQYEADYPELCSLDTIGATVEGRHLLSLCISDQPEKEEDEPEVFYTSSMHGDETAGYVLMLRLIDTLLSGYGNDAAITRMVDRMQIHINPNANPDGTYAGGDHTVSGATRYNANGVDLNRNFPDPQDGKHPDGKPWQPETLAMMSFAETHRFVLSANFHGGSEVVNYPWDTRSQAHVDEEWFETLSHAYAEPAIANSPQGYLTGISSNGVINGYDWYTISGGRQDYMTYFQGGREVTIEISDSKLTPIGYLPDLWTYNREALMQYMQECLYGIRGVVTDAAGAPVHAKVEILNHDSGSDSSVVFTDPDAGDYHRMIAPGTYDMTISADGFFPDTIRDVTVQSKDSVRVDVILRSRTSYILSGAVTEARTGDSISQVRLVLANTPYDTIYSDETGAFQMSGVAKGDYTLEIMKQGYHLLFENVSVNEDRRQMHFTLREGIIEDFEAGDLEHFSWDFGDDLPWHTTDQDAYIGSMSATSGNIDDNTRSSFHMTVDVKNDGIIHFYRKVSSERNGDFLIFSVDGVVQDSWSGSMDWERVSYPVASGIHSLEWAYEKDGANASGLDAAWIDYIEFPGLVPPVLTFCPDTLHRTLGLNTQGTVRLRIVNTGYLTADATLEVVDSSIHNWIKPGKIEYAMDAGEKYDFIYQIETGEADSIYSTHISLSYMQRNTLIPVQIQAEDVTSVEESGDLWTLRCYPNPFGQTLNIEVNLHEPGKRIIIRAFNAQGRLIKALVRENPKAGIQRFRMHLSDYLTDGEMLFLKVICGNKIAGTKLLYME